MPRGGPRPGAGRPAGSKDRNPRFRMPRVADPENRSDFLTYCEEVCNSGLGAQILERDLKSGDPARQHRALRMAAEYHLGRPVERRIQANVSAEDILIQLAQQREATIDVSPRASTPLLPDRFAFKPLAQPQEQETEPEPSVGKTPPPAPPPLRHAVSILGDPPLGVPLPEPQVLVMQPWPKRG